MPLTILTKITIKLPTLVPCMGGVGLMAARMMMHVLRTVYTLANTVTSLEDVDGNHKAMKQVNALAIFDSVATKWYVLLP